jgi:hypothetical protein
MADRPRVIEYLTKARDQQLDEVEEKLEGLDGKAQLWDRAHINAALGQVQATQVQLETLQRAMADPTISGRSTRPAAH